MSVNVPRRLRGRILPVLTIEQVRGFIALERSLTPVSISADEFEDRFYEAVAADPDTPRALIFERLNRRYVIE